MKHITLKSSFFFLFLLAGNILWGQDESHSFHYPLNVGDFWEYQYSPAFRETEEVIADTLMPNSQVYRTIRQEVFGQITLKFQRVSTENELFQYDRFETDENLFFKLSFKAGDTWNGSSFVAADSGFFKVAFISDTTLWAQNFKYAVIQDFALPDSTRPIAPNDYYIADSLGIFFHAFEGGFSELKGAIINGKKFGVITTVEGEEEILPKSLVLEQNYPNPFNDSTTVSFELPTTTDVKVEIYDMLGNQVTVLVNQNLNVGQHEVQWDGKNNLGRAVSSGLYIVAVTAENSVQVKKALLLK